jgi:hypothetical protein
MPTPHELIAQLEPDRFQEILAASPKKFREEVFRRAGIRTKTGAFSLKTEPKNEVRTQKLLTAIRDGLDLGEGVAEELIRNYLYTRRAMLSDALDHFKVSHDNGLTDEDLSFVEKLNPEEGKKLRTELAQKYGDHDVDLYFAFMNIPNA